MASIAQSVNRLATACPGSFRCLRVEAEGDSGVRLKRLGICEGRVIELVGAGDPLVLRISGARVGVSRQLAHFVILESDADVSAGP